MNYAGVAISCVSVVVFVFVKTETDIVESHMKVDEKEESINEVLTEKQQQQKAADNKRSSLLKKVAGIFLSSFAGIMFAFSYAPILYCQNNYPGASQNQNDYSFSYNSGIFLGSLFYFIVYCVVKKNKPIIYPECMFPAIISGKTFQVSYDRVTLVIIAIIYL